jgi:hypothetical protein
MQSTVSNGLPPHVRWCTTPGGGVFLDLEHNRYFGVAADAASHIERLLHSEHAAAEPDPTASTTLFETLLRQQLLQRESTHASPPTRSLAPPRLSAAQVLEGSPPARCRPLAFMAACVGAHRMIRHITLWRCAQQLRQQLDQCPPASAAQAARHALAFHRLRPYAFTARDQCLIHALSLTRYLISAGIAASWFIGVQTQPWRAHSWVQFDDVVLDADPEQVLGFTPILCV